MTLCRQIFITCLPPRARVIAVYLLLVLPVRRLMRFSGKFCNLVPAVAGCLQVVCTIAQIKFRTSVVIMSKLRQNAWCEEMSWDYHLGTWRLHNVILGWLRNRQRIPTVCCELKCYIVMIQTFFPVHLFVHFHYRTISMSDFNISICVIMFHF
jgi:hypothetical protein